MKYYSLLLGILLMFCEGCANTLPANDLTATAAATANAAPTRFVLTNEQPLMTLPLNVETFDNPAAILEITIGDIENPAAVSFSILAYFEVKPSAGSSQLTKRLSIGSISTYPANQPGKFVMSAGEAFGNLKSTLQGSEGNTVSLLLELQPISDIEPLPPVKVSIASVEWSDMGPR
jgi:hypothetical protein